MAIVGSYLVLFSSFDQWPIGSSRKLCHPRACLQEECDYLHSLRQEAHKERVRSTHRRCKEVFLQAAWIIVESSLREFF